MSLINGPKLVHSTGNGARPTAAGDDKKIVDFPAPIRADKNPTAIVYCEGNFGALDGKTANGLIRHSEKYKILSVIDSEKAGMDSGVVLVDTRAEGNDRCHEPRHEHRERFT